MKARPSRGRHWLERERRLEDEEEALEDDELEVGAARCGKGCPRGSVCGTRRTTSTNCSAMHRRERCARFRSRKSSRRATTRRARRSRESMRRLGIIEPLHVASRGRRGAIYRVIAGMRRLRAARRSGSKRCLASCTSPRGRRRGPLGYARRGDAAPQYSSAARRSQGGRARTGSAAPVSRQTVAEPTIREAVLGLEFVAALLPAMNVAGDDRLRWGVLTDLAAVELSRIKPGGQAQKLLQRVAPSIGRRSITSRSSAASCRPCSRSPLARGAR